MNKYIELIDKTLDEYMPVAYPEEIFQSMRYTVTLKGKRLRPVMCLEMCKIHGGRVEDALPAACAIEMLHAQSLIHDDLPCMDNDDFRRGKPSNHKVYGEAIATLAGDALLSFAPQLIIDKSKNLSNETLIRILREFLLCAGAYKLIGGQVADILSEKGSVKGSKEETLKYIHTHKTADLFVTALKIGAICAGAGEDKIQEAEDFGYKFGLAFQIYDDIQDEISTFEELGKTAGKDRLSGKLTCVSLYGLDGAKEKLRTLINETRTIINKYHSDIFNSILEKVSL